MHFQGAPGARAVRPGTSRRRWPLGAGLLGKWSQEERAPIQPLISCGTLSRSLFNLCASVSSPVERNRSTSSVYDQMSVDGKQVHDGAWGSVRVRHRELFLPGEHSRGQVPQPCFLTPSLVLTCWTRVPAFFLWVGLDPEP